MSDARLNVTTAKKGIALETTLCPNGVINCWSDRGSGDVHSVHLDETGSIEKCTCKGYKHTGHCYHSDTIQQNGSLRSAARACMDRNTTANLLGDVLTDGGKSHREILDMDDSERDVVEAYPETEEVDETPL